jgi:hypothetical protein
VRSTVDDWDCGVGGVGCNCDVDGAREVCRNPELRECADDSGEGKERSDLKAAREHFEVVMR